MPTVKSTPSELELDRALREHFGKQLRRVFRYSPIKKLAVFLRVVCEGCGKKRKLEIDHKDPVVPVDREITAFEYLLRMFCMNPQGEISMDNLVGLCKTCHRKKSKQEMSLRAKHKTGPYSDAAKAKRKATHERRAKTRKRKAKNVPARRKKTKS